LYVNRTMPGVRIGRRGIGRAKKPETWVKGTVLWSHTCFRGDSDTMLFGSGIRESMGTPWAHRVASRPIMAGSCMAIWGSGGGLGGGVKDGQPGFDVIPGFQERCGKMVRAGGQELLPVLVAMCF